MNVKEVIDEAENTITELRKCGFSGSVDPVSLADLIDNLRQVVNLKTANIHVEQFPQYVGLRYAFDQRTLEMHREKKARHRAEWELAAARMQLEDSHIAVLEEKVFPK